MEILLITYDIVRREPSQEIENEFRLSDHTVADGGMFCKETMLMFLEGCSEKIGGPYQIVEIDESNFSRRKYNRWHPVQGEFVFGDVERGSSRTFLVPVPDSTAYTMTGILREWIEPGTTVISDCWSAYRDLDSLGYTNRTVNHELYFVDPDTGAHTNTIESTLQRVNVFWGPTTGGRPPFHLAHSMFATRCKAKGI